MTRPLVFISYSHEDEEEKNALLTQLKVLVHTGLIDVWSDDRIGAGSDWRGDISQAILSAKVAILFVSASFLTSEFILKEEIPRLLERREREGLVVFPVIAKACLWQRVAWLKAMQVRPKNGKPIWGPVDNDIDENLFKIAEEVANIIERLSEKHEVEPITSPSSHVLSTKPGVDEMLPKPAGEAKDILSKIAQILIQEKSRLTKDPFFELGDDSTSLTRLYSTLRRIEEMLYQDVEPTFDLNKVGLSQKNIYYDALQRVKETKNFIREVQRKAKGSQENTRRAVSFLGQCLEAIKHLAELEEPAAGGLIIPPIQQPEPIENCWAIIVGVASHVDEVEYGRLPYTVDDASRLAKLLLSGPRGYSKERLRLFTDDSYRVDDTPKPDNSPTWEVILDNIKIFANKAKSNDLLLFYFSGHGILWQGQPYLVTKNTNSSYIERTGLPMSEIKKSILGSRAGAKIIILDTCHSGAIISHPKKGPTRMSEDYIRLVFEGARGSVIMTSCDANQLSFPWPEKNTSVFTHFLLDGLSDNTETTMEGLITVDALQRHIAYGVETWAIEANKEQRPRFFEDKTAGADIIIADWRPQKLNT